MSRSSVVVAAYTQPWLGVHRLGTLWLGSPCYAPRYGQGITYIGFCLIARLAGPGSVCTEAVAIVRFPFGCHASQARWWVTSLLSVVCELPRFPGKVVGFIVVLVQV